MEWPGNVRELRNTVERLLVLTVGETFGQFKEAAERAFILQKLRENDWNASETARKIDMPRSNRYKKIERFGLVRED
jgi:two-component system nitrogen regulation response regulator NtrX